MRHLFYANRNSRIVFLKRNRNLSYLITNSRKRAFPVDFGCKNVISKVLNMENKSNYEKTIEILKDNINRILNEKDRSMRWLSLNIGNNERYIARLLNGKLVPSLLVICKIAEVLRVSVEDLFTKK